MLHAVTTIGQHPRGAGLHLRNLSWALAGVPHRIHVQTFEAWHLEHPGVTFRTHRTADPMEFFSFWDETGVYLEGLLPEADTFLFTEQDILFTEPLTAAVEEVRGTGAVFPGLDTPNLAVFLPDGQRIYPRIWEGGCLLPAARVEEALAAGLSFGNYPRRLVPGAPLFRRFQTDLEAHRTRRPSPGTGPLLPLVQPLHQESVDTLFELSLYAFLHRWPVLSPPGNDQDCEAGPWMVHLRGPESLHRDFPGVYQDIRVLWRLPPLYERRLNDCALMFLLAGVCEPSAEVEHLLLSPAGLSLVRSKVARLEPRARDWMSPEEWERFAWAARLIAPAGRRRPPVGRRLRRCPAP